MVKIDLHMHSKYSDGELTPKELIDIATKKRIPAIAITDHDKVDANEEASKYAKKKDIEYVPGIEITATPPKGSRELHIVGLFIDYKNKEIKNLYKKNRKYTIETAKKIIKNLNRLGYEISFEELKKSTKGKHFGRPFIAKILMEKYPEKFKDRKKVFDELLGQNGKAFVTPKGTEMKDAISIIHKAKGIAIIAHPWYLGKNMISVLKQFVSLGGDGIEIDYRPKESIPKNTKNLLQRFAKEHNLLISGGTDFHKFEDGGKEIGDRGISKKEFLKLKEYAKINKNKIT